MLLSVFALAAEAAVDGHVDGPRRRAEDDDAALAALREVAAVVAGATPRPPPGGPEWFAASWYDEVDAWIDPQLAARGRAPNRSDTCR